MVNYVIGFIFLLASVIIGSARFEHRHGFRNLHNTHLDHNTPHDWLKACEGFVCPPSQFCNTIDGEPGCFDHLEDGLEEHQPPIAIEPVITVKKSYTLQSQTQQSTPHAPHNVRHSTGDYILQDGHHNIVDPNVSNLHRSSADAEPNSHHTPPFPAILISPPEPSNLRLSTPKYNQETFGHSQGQILNPGPVLLNPQYTTPRYRPQTPPHASHDHDYSNPTHTMPGYNQHNQQGHNEPNPSQGSSNPYHSTSGSGSNDPHHVPEPYDILNPRQEPSNPFHTTPRYNPKHSQQAHQDHDSLSRSHDSPNVPHTVPHYNTMDHHPTPPGYNWANASRDSSNIHYTTPKDPYRVPQSHDSSNQNYGSNTRHTTPGHHPQHPQHPQHPHHPPSSQDPSNPRHDSSAHHTTPGYHSPKTYGVPHDHQLSNPNQDLSHTTPSYNPKHPQHPPQGQDLHDTDHTPEVDNPLNPHQTSHGGGSPNQPNTPEGFNIRSSGHGVVSYSTPQPHHYQGHVAPQQSLYPNLHPSHKTGYNYPGIGSTPQPYHRGYPGQQSNRDSHPYYKQYYPAYPYQHNYGNIYPIKNGGYGGYRSTPAYYHKPQQYLTVPS